MLPECSVQFNQISRSLAIVERNLNKLNEKVGQLVTDSAVTRVTVENHQAELQRSMGRLWKLMLVGIGAVGGGGTAGLVNWVI